MGFKGTLGFIFIILGFILGILGTLTIAGVALGWGIGGVLIGLGFLLMILDIGLLLPLGLISFLWGINNLESGGTSVGGITVKAIVFLIIGGVLLFFGIKKRYRL